MESLTFYPLNTYQSLQDFIPLHDCYIIKVGKGLYIITRLFVLAYYPAMVNGKIVKAKDVNDKLCMSPAI